MKSYVIYRRVSTREQSKSGLGLDAQSRDIGIFLDTYSDQPYEIIGEFLDIQSGTEDDRPELWKAIALAKKQKATLLVAKLDRLSRDVELIAKLLKDERLNFRVASMPNAPKFQLHIYAALAEQERDFISQRTKAALRESNKKLGGLRDKTMKRNAVWSAQATQRARKLENLIVPLKEQGKTLEQIATALNDAKVETTRGGPWHPMTVSRLLQRLAA